MSDFLLSNAFRTPVRIAALSEKLKLHQVEIEDIVPYLSASKPALARAFETLDARYGGAYGYLNFGEMSSRIGTDWPGSMFAPSTTWCNLSFSDNAAIRTGVLKAFESRKSLMIWG